MNNIKFKQILPPEQAKFSEGGVHFWGFIDGGFVSPIGKNAEKNSFAYTGKKDINGKEIYIGDILKFKSGYSAKVIWLQNEVSIGLTQNKTSFYDYAIISRGVISE